MDNTDDILKQINSVNWFQKFENRIKYYLCKQ